MINTDNTKNETVEQKAAREAVMKAKESDTNATKAASHEQKITK